MAEIKTDELNKANFLSHVGRIMADGYCRVEWIEMQGGLVPVFRKPEEAEAKG